MFVATFLAIAGIGFFCWLLFSLAVYALPFFAAVTVGIWAYGAGAGMLGAVPVGFAAGVATLVGGQFLFGTVRSIAFRLLLALVFAGPAALAGYHAILGISSIGVPSEPWRQIFASIGAVFIGFTAAARLTLFTDIPAPRKPPTNGGRSGPGSTPASEPLLLPTPSAELAWPPLDHRSA